MAAKWYAYDRKDTKMALQTICDGLMKHKSSNLLYKELIQLEMYDAQTNNLILKDSELQKSWIEKLCKYMKMIINNIRDCEYFVELLEYLAQFGLTAPAQDVVIKHLVKDYSCKAITWNFLARRDWKGISMSYFLSELLSVINF